MRVVNSAENIRTSIIMINNDNDDDDVDNVSRQTDREHFIDGNWWERIVRNGWMRMPAAPQSQRQGSRTASRWPCHDCSWKLSLTDREKVVKRMWSWVKAPHVIRCSITRVCFLQAGGNSVAAANVHENYSFQPKISGAIPFNGGMESVLR